MRILSLSRKCYTVELSHDEMSKLVIDGLGYPVTNPAPKVNDQVQLDHIFRRLKTEEMFRTEKALAETSKVSDPAKKTTTPKV
jgi:hypothetical protein